MLQVKFRVQLKCTGRGQLTPLEKPKKPCSFTSPILTVPQFVIRSEQTTQTGTLKSRCRRAKRIIRVYHSCTYDECSPTASPCFLALDRQSQCVWNVSRSGLSQRPTAFHFLLTRNIKLSVRSPKVFFCIQELQPESPARTSISFCIPTFPYVYPQLRHLYRINDEPTSGSPIGAHTTDPWCQLTRQESSNRTVTKNFLTEIRTRTGPCLS